MSEELKACPFCDDVGEPQPSKVYDDCVICLNCGAEVSTKTWQSRPIEHALRTERDKYKQVAGDLFRLIEEHGSPTIRAHATELLEIRKVLEWASKITTTHI